MNIKGLLLGSAAALVAVSGARAADAVVIAEPEPMEYVRVCDTYGVGFYYIPGTETCLKVSGYMRYDIGIGASGFQDVLDKEDFVDGEASFNDTYYKRARFALRVDSRAETELGTLRTYAQINFQYDVETADIFDDEDVFIGSSTFTQDEVAIEHAYIELGGFRIGKTDSLFSTFTGYSSGVSNDGLVPYGPFGTHQIAYTFNGGNGFTAAVALEEGGDGEGAYDLTSYALDDYVPHVVGGVGWTGGWGGISVVGGYDSVYGEGAIKGRVDFNASDALSLFVMGAWASNDDSTLADAQNYYAPWGGEWAVWVGGAWQFNEKTTLNFEVGYDDLENFSTAVNVDYELVNNFHIIPEIVYVDNFDTDPDDNWGGFLRLQANFGG
ncbi:porin [Mesorhizobium sp. YM1C-6-2]|uniref:porin n=1 Tax=Mesorhizobium sp. YM1C-6-2 TaxID=1827501 RepID=UPI000EF2754B|nr:porin [Mesorhizobium sp. YM1C-6-2]RLP25367.1 porin [Mesorhizobium sp. YM1C-6-2]